jgi:hypothetical protein
MREPEEKRTFARPTSGWVDNIKMTFKREEDWMIWIELI